MDKEQKLRNQLNKIQDKLNHIRQQKIEEYREKFVGKYFHDYIDNGHNRHQYVYVDKIEDGVLYGWWFTTGDTFTHEYSISSRPSVVVDFIADGSFYADYNKDEEITKEKFWERFQYIIDCVEQIKLEKK